MKLNLFPRIIILEVKLTPPQIMQAIHDNINSKNTNTESVFNQKILDGTTSGNQFDVNVKRGFMDNKQVQIFLHGETKLLENGLSEVEISCYPFIGLLFAVIFLPFMLFTLLSQFTNILNGNNLILNITVIVFLFVISLLALSLHFIRDFKNSLDFLRQVFSAAEMQNYQN